MKKNLKPAIMAITFLPLLVYVFAYSLLGSTIPLTWNDYGEVTSYVAKSPAMFIIPSFAIYISIIMYFIPSLRKKETSTIFGISFEMFWLFVSIFAAIGTMFPLYLIAFDGGNTYNLVATSLLVIAGLTLITGFVFPSFKYEGKYGFNTPWTKASKGVFLKTQQIASATFVIGGLLLGTLTLFVTDHMLLATLAYILVALIIVFIPLWYSKTTYENEE